MMPKYAPIVDGRLSDMEMCQRDGLLEDLPRVSEIIQQIYGDVPTDCALSKQSDPDGHDKICFVIHAKGETSQLTKNRKKLRQTIYEKIPAEKRKFLRFTYHIT